VTVQAEVRTASSVRAIVQRSEAAIEMYQIYNTWLADFCKHAPDRFIGLGSLTPFDLDAAVAEVRRAGTLGLKGLEFATSPDMIPLYDPRWEPLWQAVNDVALPMHFHTTGGGKVASRDHLPLRAQRGVRSFGAARNRAVPDGDDLWWRAGALSEIRIVLGESGIGWIPYILDRMDYEYEDQFHNDRALSMKPSDYWKRQCRATFRSTRWRNCCTGWAKKR
jgi:predicted TIM-barrel fold metal-dependent hydrolase